MIIDIHTHAWPDKVAIRAKEHLESLFHEKMVDIPTINNLIKYMDKNRIDVSVVSSVATRPEQVRPINDWLFTVRNDRIRVFAAMHPGYARYADELKRVSERGDGIKLQPEFQNFYIDDESVYPLYETAEDLQLPVLFHCGEELSGTHLIRSGPDRMLRVRKKFPGLIIIAAHFGGFNMWDEVSNHLLGTDIYLDTAFFFSHVSQDKALSMVKRHSPGRVLFGTDFPLCDQDKDIEAVNLLDIDQDHKDKILFKNAQELLMKRRVV